MTPLHSTLKRALTIDARDYVLTLTPAGLKLTLKGKRNGVELSWTQLVSGEAALAVALHASLGAFASKDKVSSISTSPKTTPSRAKTTPSQPKAALRAAALPTAARPRMNPKRKTRPARKK
jgi:hypothetical protein